MQNLSNDAPSLDHLGWIVTDLFAGAIAWEGLGFRLSRISPQMGFTGPDGTLELWASANRCAVLETGYLELIGIVDPGRFNPWQTYLARGDSPHIAAFRVMEADLAFPSLISRVQGFEAPVQRSRMAPLGLFEDQGDAEMRFRNIFSQDKYWPEGRFIVIEHQTPEILWQADLLEHPNGARALVEAVFASLDPASTIDRLARLLNRAHQAGAIKAQGGGKITVLKPTEFAERFPGATAPNRPSIAAAVVSVSDLSTIDRLTKANGLQLNKTPGGGLAAIGPASAGGVIEFVQA